LEEEKSREIKDNNSEEIKIDEEEAVESESEEHQKEVYLEKKEKKKLTFKEKTISFLKNKWNLAFLVVLFLALLIRLKYIGQESLWNDAAVHLWYTFKAIENPLYIFSSEYLIGDYVPIQTLTVLLYTFTKNLLIAGKITAILFGIVGIVFMYLLGSELKNKFMGLISAALLGFHHLFWFYGVRLLADGPLVTMVVVTLYCLVKLEKEKTLFWGFFSAFAFLVMMLTKKQSILFFVAFLIYLIIFKRWEAIKNKAILVSWLVPVSSIAFGSLLFGGSFIISFVKRFFVNPQGLYDPGLKATMHFPWIFSWYLLIPMILGLFFVLMYKKREYYLGLIFFLFYWISFEISVRTPEDRYLLPLLPIGILFASFALLEISNYLVLFIGKRKWGDYLRKGLVILFVVFVCWHFYSIGDMLIDNKSTSYAGHREAGQWLKENVLDGIPIFVGSPRMERPFIEREYGGPGFWNKGGSLWYLRADEYLKNQSAFEEDLEILSKESDVYLEIDIWEYEQPSWYFPINQDSLDYFTSLGFQLIKVVEREVNTQQGRQKMPVIFIFKKDKVD
jgi:hypothetical protein